MILAAGRGLRLHSHTKKYPKPLTKILGKPLIEHTLQALKSVGVVDIIVVTGYLASKIQKRLRDGTHLGVKIQYCHNPHYMLENAISLKTAEKVLKNGESFLLLMGDHYFDKVVIKKALEHNNRQPLLCIDKNPRHSPQIKDATKVLVNNKNYIIDIGKEIPVWNAVDVGLFLLDNTIFSVIHSLEKQKPNLSITECIRQLSSKVKPVWGCDVSGCLWFDIDTPQDIEFVESFLKEASKCQKNGTE